MEHKQDLVQLFLELIKEAYTYGISAVKGGYGVHYDYRFANFEQDNKDDLQLIVDKLSTLL